MKKGKSKKNSSSLIAPPISEQDLMYEDNRTRKDRIAIWLLFGVGVVSSLFIATKTFHFLKYDFGTEEVTNQTYQEDSIRQEIAGQQIQFDPINKVSILKDGNIFVYELDGQALRQITYDASAIKTYSNLTWKDDKHLSFSECFYDTCSIKTYNYETQQFLDEEISFEGVIQSLRWSTDGGRLGILSYKEENFFFQLRNDKKIIFKSEVSGVRRESYTFDDASYIRFSPEGEFVMIVNTFVQEGWPVISVFSIEGEQVLSFNKSSSTNLSFSVFMGENTIYFKKGDLLYSREFDSDEDLQVTDRVVGAFGFEPSPDRKKLTYWTYDWDSSTTTMWVYNVSEDSIKRLADHAFEPSWVDENNVVAIKTDLCHECFKENLPMEGIGFYDHQKRMFDVVVEGKVTEFKVNNY